MIDVRQTRVFRDWLAGLRDQSAARRVQQRISRLAIGLFGDAKTVGGGVSELRVDHGPGDRVYFVRRGETLVILLCGGDKRRQQQDIALARRMVEDLSRDD